MRLFTQKEQKIMEKLICMSEQQILKSMYKICKQKYKDITLTKDYLCMKGDIPIALVAHADKVFPTNPSNILYDKDQNIMIGVGGAGFDDRAGIFAILHILSNTDLKPSIVITTAEERGGFGADAFSRLELNNYKDHINYFIELDRRGSNDCVFYDCVNDEFTKYIEGFGFHTAFGTFSDIGVICEDFGIAGVNLSIGYRDEHTASEVLYVNNMFSTIDKVIDMLSQKNIPFFKFIPNPCYRFSPYYHFNRDCQCAKCKLYFTEDELFPVEGLGHVCPDCLCANQDIDWCPNCGEAYLVSKQHKCITGYKK